MPETEKHYLEKELYERMQSDSMLFEFLVSSSLDGLWYWDLESPEHQWIHPRIWEILEPYSANAVIKNKDLGLC